MFTVQDCQWMAQALRLAEQGLYSTSPNPRVGCVLVADGRIVGSGWHRRAGQEHAEVHALHQAGGAARGATAYVTLEPCSHHGRTPPCADALISAGVGRVVVAVADPNPQVSGTGSDKLRSAGLSVETGLMEAAARELNIGFFSRMARGTPWLRSKIGMSLDGRTALANGVSKWITGEAARRDVQHWRARSCAVLTGIDTVIADDPQLNVRWIGGKIQSSQDGVNYPSSPLYQGGAGVPPLTAEGSLRSNGEPTGVPLAGARGRQDGLVVRQPMRVVVDSKLRIPMAARILHGAMNGNVLIYTATRDDKKCLALEKAGVLVCVLPDGNGQVELPSMIRDLAQRGCNEVLVEAGSILNGALLRAGVTDELLLYIAPQLLGDMARGIAQLGELVSLDQCVNLKWQDMRQVGADIRIMAKVENV